MRHSQIEEMKERLHQGISSALEQGADGAKINFHQSESIGCEFEAGRLKSTDASERAMYSIEVLVDGKRSSVSGNMLDDIDEMISRALSLAGVGSVAHFKAYPAPAEIYKVKTHARETAELSRETMIEHSQKIVERLKAYDPDLWIHASSNRSEYENLLVTTGGVVASNTGTVWSLSGYIQRTEGSDMLFVGDRRVWRNAGQYYDPEYIAERIIKDLQRAEKLSETPVGKFPIYLSPEMFRRLIGALMLGVNGRNVAKGDSPLRGKLREQVLDKSLTIIDNPHRDFSPGAARFDANGIPTRIINIFEKGVLMNFLYDLDSSGLAGANPTGHNGCSPHDLEVLSGDTPRESLVTAIQDGLYIKDLIGFGQSNIMNGDFSANVGLGYGIKNGEITGRVKNTMIAGNLYEILKKDVRLSSERDPLMLFPYAVVEGMTISAAQ